MEEQSCSQNQKQSSLAAAVLAAGFSAANAQEKVWKHGILEAKSDSGFIAMVDKGGFAAKHGLKVEILQIKAGATLMKALIAGEIDSVDMGAAESIVAGVRGTGVKIVGCTWPGVPQVVLAKAEIKTLADLKGKTVAISSPGSLPDLLFRGMLDAANMPFADVKLATQGADLDRYKSLVAGITDAAVVSNEFEAVMPPNIHVLAKGEHRGAEIHPPLRRDQQQGAGRAARRSGEIRRGGNGRLQIRRRAPRRDHQAGA